MYSTGRVSLETQQGKEEGENSSEKACTPHTRQAQAQPCSLSLTPTRPKCGGGIKKGPFFPIPTSFLSRDYRKCLFASVSFGKGKKPLFVTPEKEISGPTTWLSIHCVVCRGESRAQYPWTFIVSSEMAERGFQLSS